MDAASLARALLESAGSDTFRVAFGTACALAWSGFATVLAPRTRAMEAEGGGTEGDAWRRSMERGARWSACDHCGRRLGAWEKAPIVGWLAAGGRCRGCKWVVPIRYTLWEVGGTAACLASAEAWMRAIGPWGWWGGLAAAMASEAAMCIGWTGKTRSTWCNLAWIGILCAMSDAAGLAGAAVWGLDMASGKGARRAGAYGMGIAVAGGILAWTKG